MRQKSSIHLCQRPWRILLSQSCILTRKLAFCKSIWCGLAPSVLLLTTRSFFKIGISSCKLYQKYISIWGSFCDFYEIFAILANEPLQGPRHQNVFFSSCDVSTFYEKDIIHDNGLKLYLQWTFEFVNNQHPITFLGSNKVNFRVFQSHSFIIK